MTLEEEECFYAYIEGKHCALDEKKDGMHFYMNMQTWFSGNRNIWRSFREGYLEHTKGRKLKKFDENWRNVSRAKSPPPVGSF